MFDVEVTIPKSLNSVWAGKGKLLRVDMETGCMAIVYMHTGRCKGETGGFPLDHLKFKTVKRPPLVQEPEPFFHD